MFERFTERARQVVVLSQEEARLLKHNYIGTEHILLGVLREERGLAAQVLESFDITIERATAQVVSIVGSGEGVTSGQIPFTPRAKKVLELGLSEATRLAHDEVATHHILLGLLREGGGVANRVLLDCQADPEEIRAAVMAGLEGAPDEGLSSRPTAPDHALGVAGQIEGTASQRSVFARFTERASDVLVRAQEEVRELGHSKVGTEHILLGLLLEREGLAARVLGSLDVTVDHVRAEVVRMPVPEQAPAGQIPLTPAAQKALELALREALALGHNYIGTEHILLGLVRANEGAASRILLDLDADSQKIRNEIIRTLSRARGTDPGDATPESGAAPTHREFEVQFEESATAHCSFCGQGGRTYRSCLPGAEDVRICEACIDLFPRIASMHHEDHDTDSGEAT